MKNLLFAILVMFSSIGVSASENSDRLSCKSFISNLNDKDITAIIFTALIENVTNFGYLVNSQIIEDMKKKHGADIKMEGIVTENFFTTQLAISIINPKYVIEQCAEKPEGYLEEIGRATWIAAQQVKETYPESHWKAKIRKQFQ